jgi:hypothetical protein
MGSRTFLGKDLRGTWAIAHDRLMFLVLEILDVPRMLREADIPGMFQVADIGGTCIIPSVCPPFALPEVWRRYAATHARLWSLSSASARSPKFFLYPKIFSMLSHE